MIALRRCGWLHDLVGADHRRAAGALLGFSFGWMICRMTPPSPLGENAMVFLATLAAGVILWAFEAFDEYIVGLMMLFSWLLLGVAPSEVVLSGFSKSAWIFVVGVFGMAAAVTTSGLLKRVAFHFLRNVRPTYRWYTSTLGALGFLLTPLLPNTKGRMGIVAPLTQAVGNAIGLAPRSNGAAGLTLSAYVGLSQLNVLFLTGATTCLVGWSLLPDVARSEFGWHTWFIAALPAAVVNFLLLLLAIQFLFRVRKENSIWTCFEKTEIQLERLGPLTRNEWITLVVVSLTLLGWITTSLHGIHQAWLALGALVGLLLTGVLDKKSLKNNIDWGFLLFFGIVYSLAGLSSYLKIDLWLKEWMSPILSAVSFHPIAFLMTVVLLVYCVRFFMFKVPTVILFSLILTPWARQLGIHPGVLLLTVLMGMEVWFFSYQQPSYQIAYYSTGGEGFSYAQGRKLMAVKFVASLIALAISVPYWTALGFIKEPTGSVVHSSARGAATTEQAVVAKIQALLFRLGYRPGPIDGILGPRTRAAIGRYQEKSGMSVDRKPSELLLVHLQSAGRH